MKSKKEDKYIVLKKEDLDNYFSQFTKGVFTTDEEQNIIDTLTWKEVLHDLQNDNKYIVCNQDEPYADSIWQIILMGEDAKRVNLNEKKLKDTFGKFAMEYYRTDKKNRTNVNMSILLREYFPLLKEEP